MTGNSVPLHKRCLAKALDMIAIVFASLVLPHPVGVFIGLIYILIHDGLPGGQSLGKRVFGLRTVMFDGTEGGGHGQATPCDFAESALRNAPLGAATFFAIIPFWGWFISVLLGVPMIAIEIYLMVTRPQGARLGDVMADTRVVLAKSISQ
jgi:hypothetical protein